MWPEYEPALAGWQPGRLRLGRREQGQFDIYVRLVEGGRATPDHRAGRARACLVARRRHLAFVETGIYLIPPWAAWSASYRSSRVAVSLSAGSPGHLDGKSRLQRRGG
jgi:hypothetical protein